MKYNILRVVRAVDILNLKRLVPNRILYKRIAVTNELPVKITCSNIRSRDVTHIYMLRNTPLRG